MDVCLSVCLSVCMHACMHACMLCMHVMHVCHDLIGLDWIGLGSGACSPDRHDRPVQFKACLRGNRLRH